MRGVFLLLQMDIIWLYICVEFIDNVTKSSDMCIGFYIINDNTMYLYKGQTLYWYCVDNYMQTCA